MWEEYRPGKYPDLQFTKHAHKNHNQYKTISPKRKLYKGEPPLKSSVWRLAMVKRT